MNDLDYAIVIGVRYRFLRPLRATLTDATNFTEWLTNDTGGGIPPDSGRIKLIQSPRTGTSSRPLQVDIDDALREFGVHKGEPIGRRLYFYFSGHGFGTMGEDNDVGMLMADAEMEALNTNIGLNKYTAMFRNTHFFNEVIFILDCCRDAAPEASNMTLGTNRSRFSPVHNNPDPPVRIFTVLAAEYGRKAFEPRDKTKGERRGLLTQAVLEGLTLPHIADPEGRFTAESLRKYLLRRVKELAHEVGDPKLEQNPEFFVPSEEIIFACVPDQDVNKVSVRIMAPNRLSGDIVVRDHEMVEIDRRPAAEITRKRPPWKVELARNRMYAVTQSNGQQDVVSNPLPWPDVEAKNYEYVFRPSR